MKYEKRLNKDGSFYYSFVFYDSQSKKRIRLSRSDIKNRFGRDITDETDAAECLKLLSAQFESQKRRIEKRLAWEKEFYNFAALCDQYEQNQRKKAPNSWKNNVFYLKHYVLPFFLTQKRLNNIELWPDFFESFRVWLETDAKQIRNDQVISFSSKNHAIKALNTLLDMLYQKKIIHRIEKCEAFPEHLIGKRTIDDVVFPEEMEQVYSQLKLKGFNLEATFFRFCFFSGMRFSEAMAISLNDLFQGELPKDQLLSKKVKNYGIIYHGYIVSESQVDEKFIRYPFKGKKEISERFARTVPIIDKVLWNELVELASEQFELWQNNKGISKAEFFLFRGIDDTTSSRRLEESFKACGLNYRSWHCLRHSRATWLIGETGDEVLARVWLGHSSPRIFERYNHLYQSIVRAARAQETVGKTFNLKKV